MAEEKGDVDLHKTPLRPLTWCLGVSRQLILGHPCRWRRHPAWKRRYNYKSKRNHVPEHYNLQNERWEELKLREYEIIFDNDTKECSHQICFEEGIFVAPTYRLQKLYRKLRFHITPFYQNRKWCMLRDDFCTSVYSICSLVFLSLSS